MLLLLVFATFVFICAAPDREWATFISVMLQGGMLLFAMRVSRSRPRYICIAEVGVAVALLTTIFALFVGNLRPGQPSGRA